MLMALWLKLHRMAIKAGVFNPDDEPERKAS